MQDLSLMVNMSHENEKYGPSPEPFAESFKAKGIDRGRSNTPDHGKDALDPGPDMEPEV